MNKLLNKRNGIIAGVVVVVLVIAVVVSTSFSSAMNLDKAKNIAKNYVPSSAEFIESEEEDRYFEVAFYDKANKEGFEVEVIKETEKVKKVESQLSNDAGSTTIVLTEDEAKKVVKDRFEGITSLSAVLTKDNGLFEYEVSFKADDFYGDADVNAETGAILDSVIKYGTAVTIPADDSSENEFLTYQQAKDLAVEHAGGGIVRDIDLDREGQNYFYEAELHINGMEREYYINANTSEVVLLSEHRCYFDDHHEEDPYAEPEVYVPEENIDENVDNYNENVDNFDVSADVPYEEPVDNPDLISEQEAKDIIWAKIPGAEIIELYLERDDGRQEYEGKAHLDGYEYEFEINAASGVITNWDREVIEYDDDDEWDD